MRTSVQEPYLDPALPALSYELAGLADRRAMLAATRQLLQRLIPCDDIAFNSVDRDRGTAEVVGAPYLEDPEVARLLAEVDDHPMIVSYLAEGSDGRSEPRRVSDVISQRDYRRTRAYNELLRPLGVEQQLTVLTGRFGPAGARCWTLARTGRGFTDGELELAGLLQPLLVAADRAYPSASPGPAGPAGAEQSGLTPREVQILRLVARGLTAEGCAHVLRIATGTVRKHLENAYAKLGVHDRLMAVEESRRRGILPGG